MTEKIDWGQLRKQIWANRTSYGPVDSFVDNVLDIFEYRAHEEAKNRALEKLCPWLLTAEVSKAQFERLWRLQYPVVDDLK